MLKLALSFTLLLGVAVQRLWECRTSLEHEQKLRAWGAVEHAPEQVPFMVALHVAWFVAIPLEVLFLHHQPKPIVWLGALLVFGIGQVLRVTAMRALGVHWTIKIITLPGSRAVEAGPFRRIRHPNYLGVWLETVALPLVYGAWLTALVFGLAQAAFLMVRIRAEEAALSQTTNYAVGLGKNPRFVPRVLSWTSATSPSREQAQ
jgi:methyltransferase